MHVLISMCAQSFSIVLPSTLLANTGILCCVAAVGRLDDEDDDHLNTGSSSIEHSSVKMNDLYHEREPMPPPSEHGGDWHRPNKLPLSGHPRSSEVGSSNLGGNHLVSSSHLYEDTYSPVTGGQYQVPESNSYSQMSSNVRLPIQPDAACSSDYAPEAKMYPVEQPSATTPLHGYAEEQRAGNELMTASGQHMVLSSVTPATVPDALESDHYVRIVPVNAGRFSPLLHHAPETQCPYPSLPEQVYHMTAAHTPTHVVHSSPAHTPHVTGPDQVEGQAFKSLPALVDGRIRDESYETYPKPSYGQSMGTSTTPGPGSLEGSNGSYQMYSMSSAPPPPQFHHNSNYPHRTAGTVQSPTY